MYEGIAGPNRLRRPVWSAVSVMALCLITTAMLSACDEQSQAEELIRSSIEAMNGLKSYQFEERGETNYSLAPPGEEGGKGFRGTGAFRAPDRLQREGEQIKSRDSAVEYRSIRVGDTDYALDPHTQKWKPDSGALLPRTPLRSLTPVEALSEIFLGDANLSKSITDHDSFSVERKNLDGVDVHHVIRTAEYRGTSSCDNQSRVEVRIEAWIGVSDLLVRKIQSSSTVHYERRSKPVKELCIDILLPQVGTSSNSWMLKFTDYNSDVTIDPPEDAQPAETN